MKKIFAVAMAVLMIFSFAACGNKDDNGNSNSNSNLETYTVSGLTIQMEKGLTQATQSGFDAFFSGDRAAMAGVKETADEFTPLGYDVNSLSEEDYASMVAEANGFEGFTKNANGRFVYTYVENVEGDDYFYYTTVRKGSDCFWVINFFCANDDAKEYQPKFNQWAETIEVQ